MGMAVLLRATAMCGLNSATSPRTISFVRRKANLFLTPEGVQGDENLAEAGPPPREEEIDRGEGEGEVSEVSDPVGDEADDGLAEAEAVKRRGQGRKLVASFVGVEERRLELERRRLEVDERKLRIEERKVELKERKLKVKEKKQKSVERIVQLLESSTHLLDQVGGWEEGSEEENKRRRRPSTHRLVSVSAMGTTRLTIGIFALAVLGFVHADDGFFGSGVETVYRYFADVRAESQVPQEYASQFGIKADLHVQSIEGSKAIFQFQDVSYQVSNGKLDTHEFSDAKFVASPPESDVLKQPFEVVYEGGKVKSVLTFEEPLWSTNIKKAVAAIFQLDLPQLHYDQPSNFWSEEKSLFGKCNIGYTILPKESGYVDVMKMQEYSQCEKFPTRYFSNGEYEKCKYDHQENYLLMGGTRYYKLSTEGGLKIKEIYAKSVAAAVPFNGASDDQSVLVRQNFTFVSVKPIVQPISFTPANEEQDLTYVIPSYYNADGTMADVTGGRVHFAKEEIMDKAYKSLEKLVHYMDEMKVVADPTTLNRQVIEPVTYYLGLLDATSLAECFEKYTKPKTPFEEKMRVAFLEMAAQVGSKASVMFIRDMIVSHKIPDSFASEILRLVPLYVRDPTAAMAKEYEAILNVDMDARVKNSAVLSVANMASVAYKKVHDTEMFNHFADKFFESFKTATKYGVKLNYLTALVNLADGEAFDYLVQVVQDKSISSHLRYVALWGTHAGGMKNPTKVRKFLISHDSFFNLSNDASPFLDTRCNLF
ncbi:uncharacterized protein LOC124164990 [Ischnura elegans]|uniref:uncharacterized protein LOC124164990 n=1 Tax=Ischnura elegans TaxID=197161 RepID=UPI001ED89090|nr:uncharacterized protein LOC124164990 [Ischnura elegans]